MTVQKSTLVSTLAGPAVLLLAGLILHFTVFAPPHSRRQQDEVSHGDILGEPRLVAGRGDLQHTVVTPILECDLPVDSNVIWCASVQLAWDELVATCGSQIGADGPGSIPYYLSHSQFRSECIDPQSYVARAGKSTAGLLEEIRRELQLKFHNAARPALLPSSDDLPECLAYCYLFKALPFEHPFLRTRCELRFRNGARVEAFGLHDYSWSGQDARDAGAQVSVFDYRNENDFILELRPTDPDDRIVLAKIQPEGTLLATIEATRDRMATCQPQPMQPHRDLMIPVLDFELQWVFLGLVADLYAEQQIRLKLDETGAFVQSEAVVLTEVQLERYVFNRAYLLALWRRGAALPYLAIWVANEEILLSCPPPNVGQSNQ